MTSYIQLILCVLFFGVSFPDACKALPPNSIYNVSMRWIDDQGRPISLGSFQGREVVLTMAYTKCTSACPLTMQRLKKIDDQLVKEGKSAEFVIVSFDTKRDSPDELAHFRAMKNLNSPHWHFLTGSSGDIRKLSLVLGMSYQQDQETKEFTHSNKIILLNRDGEIGVSVEGLASDVMPIVNAAGR